MECYMEILLEIKLQTLQWTNTIATSPFYAYPCAADVDLMKRLNFDGYRFSISLSRIFPDGEGRVNQEGVAYYNNLINYVLKKAVAGLRPTSPGPTSQPNSLSPPSLADEWGPPVILLLSPPVKLLPTVKPPPMPPTNANVSSPIDPSRPSYCSHAEPPSPHMASHLLLCHRVPSIFKADD
ncbi:hypothetical protein EJB05_27209, partial [Eragrostis curvula]